MGANALTLTHDGEGGEVDPPPPLPLLPAPFKADRSATVRAPCPPMECPKIDRTLSPPTPHSLSTSAGSSSATYESIR